MTAYLNVFVTEEFVVDGKEKTRYTKVGVAFPHKKGEGYNIKVIPGIALTGDLVMFPPSEGEDNDTEDANGNS